MQTQLFAISTCRQHVCLILLQMQYSAIFCIHLQSTCNHCFWPARYKGLPITGIAFSQGF